ncbi:MAG: elongation factor 4 [Candidatus Yanofskybacteria bacterium RIFCSPHIGHO2_02_FULL_39_10]|uniref:Elongation factor 4 n=1 Tax=Candidatus Yanofskybacteria bacterium RIFCSPHIGHO2_02_FULL_39_10 TaxID=1802674 RepID=A0A1F8F9V8_9BACT|nr:MAG: elongation factor 4 [Candidatus Yanofskybacteria bacterium RIFCSPHIGHO2_02_FULL_39_10]
MNNIRNFCIIAHIDAGKSTLADRFLELTKTVEKRKMQEQYLDQMELERERGITIKLQPVRMKYHANRRITQNSTQNNTEFLYKDLTYKLRGLLFEIRKSIGLGHKEQVYHNALEIELQKTGLKFESKKNVLIIYHGQKIGVYQPDFVVEDKIIIELKALPEIARPQIEQVWSYLKGCDYKLALLVNFGSKDLDIKRVVYDSARSASSLRDSAGVSDKVEYILNLIDTPGHVDFSYEVSRSLAAVEGAILLVDGVKGIQAQTLANLHLAQEQKLKIIPVLNKIDLPNVRKEQIREELSSLLMIDPEEIIEISAKNGTNVERVLERVIKDIPSPEDSGREQIVGGVGEEVFKALIFDSTFDAYKGVIAYVRVFSGSIKREDKLLAYATQAKADVIEVGYFLPKINPSASINSGEIGYIATGLKDPGLIRVGDTITLLRDNTNIETLKRLNFQPLAGYKEPRPMVFASFFPENSDRSGQDDYDMLRDALGKLKLTDAALIYEPESSAGLGRGFRVGFLGMLHVEIISERLRREFGLNLIVSSPSVEYIVKLSARGGSQPEADQPLAGAKNFGGKDNNEIKIRSAAFLPDPTRIESIAEPMVIIEIIAPSNYLGSVMDLVSHFRNTYISTEYLGKDTVFLKYKVPLAEIVTDFYDKLKSVSSGYASMSYELVENQINDLVRLDILLAGDMVEPFSRIVPREKADFEGREMVLKLKSIVPAQWFQIAIQAVIGGKIIARETITARRKDVTGYLYGGDVTRKNKLLDKQKRGKKKMEESGKVNLSQEVFLKMLKR